MLKQVQRGLHQVEQLRQLTEYKRLQAQDLERRLHPLLTLPSPLVPAAVAEQFRQQQATLFPEPEPMPLPQPEPMPEPEPENLPEPEPRPTLPPEQLQAIDRLLGLGQPQS